jgi:hypothetical protein
VEDFMVGQAVSHYNILEKLGGGRMGVVCKVGNPSAGETKEGIYEQPNRYRKNPAAEER